MLDQGRKTGRWLTLVALLFSSLVVQARTVADAGDGLVIEGIPQRVVVLEYSFIDALAAVGVSPVGIADDNKPERIVAPIRQLIGDYQSVGLRGQPNLETIAQLRPDLIIADPRRHQAVYDDLQTIAPTLLVPSLGSDYDQVLETAATIGDALGRREQMQTRLQLHQQRMDQYHSQLQQLSFADERFLFAIISSRGFTMHSPAAFASGVLRRIGMQHALPQQTGEAYIKSSFEQLAQANPDWLLLGIYGKEEGGGELLERWQADPLWNFLSAVKKQQVREVSPQVWSLSRGMVTAEQIAAEVVELSRR